MQKNEILILDIADQGMNGEGIAKPEGFVVFVPHALTGERVEAKILKVNKNFAYAKLVRVLSSSPDRVLPPCAVFNKCGGCSLMHMSYEAQKRFKRQAVKNCLLKAGITAEVAETVGSEKTLAYRNKLQLPVSGEGIGFYRENSHTVVDIEECPVTERSGALISALREYMKLTGDEAYDEGSACGNIRHAVTRSVTEQVLITVVSAEGKLRDEACLIEVLKKSFSDFGLYLNVNRKRNNVILGRDYRHIYGREFLEGEMLGIKYKITPDIFLQVNDAIAAKIYADTAKLIAHAAPEAVIDAYSGISVLSGILSRAVRRVYAIEINPNSFEAAEEVKRQNGLDNLTNICGDTAERLPELLSQNPQIGRLAVILDPPRKGCDAPVLDALLRARPQTIIYISCNPATLARDLKTLFAAYQIASVTPYDMFPQTRHVETLVCLTLKD